MEIVVLLAAELDIQAAFNRFEEYREGLGVTFLQELGIAYEYLQHHPRIGRLYAEDRRWFLVPNFPFGIFYSVTARQNHYFRGSGPPARPRADS
jgi:hypothetical protein